MAALLTNETGVEVQLKWRWQGKNRYMNNLYVPNTSATDWVLSHVMNTIFDDAGWISLLSAAVNEDCILESITGRVRGREDAGDTDTRNIEQAGSIVGQGTPAWLTFNVWQIPDNVNRLIVSGTPTLFKRGRMAFPGITDIQIDGNNLESGAKGAFVTAAGAMLSIPAGTSGNTNPAFSLVMTRREKLGEGPEFPYILRAKCNVTQVIGGKIGTQLTAR